MRIKLLINIIIVTKNKEENDELKFIAKSRKREWRGNRVTNKLSHGNDASKLDYERTLKNKTWSFVSNSSLSKIFAL